MTDYYKVLGVPKTATAEEIKKAYRKLAKQYHPDANGGDKAAEQQFIKINQAYDTLGDEKKRKEYDEMRENPFAGAAFMPQSFLPPVVWRAFSFRTRALWKNSNRSVLFF